VKLPKFTLVTLIIFNLKYLILFLLLFINCFNAEAQFDSIKQGKKFSLNEFLQESSNLNISAKPVNYVINERNFIQDDFNFYVILFVVFYFAIIKAVFSKYFATLFRVFFNASLRQSQLTDQLVQAALPSLLYNILFSFTFTLYIYYFIQHSGIIKIGDDPLLIFYILSAVVVLYILKWSFIKFLGWLSNFNKLADNYLFIVFLLNKILGICLLPLIVLIAFSNSLFVNIALIISYVLIFIIFALRYLKMYETITAGIKMNKLHFLLLVFALEILPIMLISKTAVELFVK